LLGVGVVTGVLLRVIFPELDLGLGIVAGVLGAGFSSYLVYKLLLESMVEEVEVPVLERMADLPYIIEHRPRSAKEGKGPRPRRSKNKPPPPPTPSSTASTPPPTQDGE
jgi:hypothetical protein